MTNASHCDDNIPACANCTRYGFVCLFEDPVSRRELPRNYVETLEQRLAYVESLLRQQHVESLAVPPQTGSSIAAAFESPVVRPSETGDTDSAAGDLHDLASQVGTLSLNAAGAEPQYLGPSSTFAFARLIRPIITRVHPVTSANVSDAEHDPHNSTISPLPDPQTARILSNAYFDNVHTQYPFLYESQFRGWESTFVLFEPSWSGVEFDPVALFFLNMVYAIGALLVPQTEYTADRLYTTAMCYIDPIISTDSIEGIQAILCCAAFSLRSPVGTSHWKLAGLAVRQCVDFGYHRRIQVSDSTVDPIRSELRKRVFWSAYSMECAACIHLGRPLSLHYHEIDAELPTDADDLYIASSGTQGQIRLQTADSPTDVSRAISSIRLRAWQGRVQTALYCDIRSKLRSNAEQVESVTQLRAELDDWHATLPPLSAPRGPALSLFMTDDWPLMVHNQAMLQLYRPELTRRSSDHGKADIIALCVSLAAELCHAYRRQFFGKSTTYTWGALHELFLAGLTYIYCIRNSADIRKLLGYEKISKVCNDCTIAFVILAERWKDAIPYRDLFEALSSSLLAFVSKQDSLPPAHSAPATAFTAHEAAAAVEEIDFSKMFAEFTDEVDAPGQVDTMLDALLMDWTGD